MRVGYSAVLALFSLCDLLLLCLASRHTVAISLLAVPVDSKSVDWVNVAGAQSNASLISNEDSFATMIDRALEREFPESEQNEGSKLIRALPICLLGVRHLRFGFL